MVGLIPPVWVLQCPFLHCALFCIFLLSLVVLCHASFLMDFYYVILRARFLGAKNVRENWQFYYANQHGSPCAACTSTLDPEVR